jgi:hypothetical protein
VFTWTGREIHPGLDAFGLIGPVLGGSGDRGHAGDFVSGAETVGHLAVIGIGAEAMMVWSKVW